MSKIERYHRGSNHGGIVETPMGFTASTATKSRAFKTWTAADKFLRKEGYMPGDNNEVWDGTREDWVPKEISGRCGSAQDYATEEGNVYDLEGMYINPKEKTIIWVDYVGEPEENEPSRGEYLIDRLYFNGKHAGRSYTYASTVKFFRKNWIEYFPYRNITEWLSMPKNKREKEVEDILKEYGESKRSISGSCGSAQDYTVETYWVDEQKFIPKGEYKETEVDRHKKEVDFLLRSIDGEWYSIWFNRPVKLKPGRGIKSYDEEGHAYAVTESVLKKLDKQYTSATDF